MRLRHRRPPGLKRLGRHAKRGFIAVQLGAGGVTVKAAKLRDGQTGVVGGQFKNVRVDHYVGPFDLRGFAMKPARIAAASLKERQMSRKLPLCADIKKIKRMTVKRVKCKNPH